MFNIFKQIQNAINNIVNSLFPSLKPKPQQPEFGTENPNGTSGNDKILGWGVINAGKGDDTITIGKAGTEDTLIYQLGDGRDTVIVHDYINEDKITDKIVFGEGITENMVKFIRVNNDLTISVAKTDSITIKDYFVSAVCQSFHRIEFANGTVWENFRDKPIYVVGSGDGWVNDEDSKNWEFPALNGKANFSAHAGFENQANQLVASMSTFAVEGADASFSAQQADESAFQHQLAVNVG